MRFILLNWLAVVALLHLARGLGLSLLSLSEQRLQVGLLLLGVAHVVGELVVHVVGVRVSHHGLGLFALLERHGDLLLGVVVIFVQIHVVQILEVLLVVQVVLAVRGGGLARVLLGVLRGLLEVGLDGLGRGLDVLLGVLVLGLFLAVEHVVVLLVALGLEVASEMDLGGALDVDGNVLGAVDVEVQHGLLALLVETGDDDFGLLSVLAVDARGLGVGLVGDSGGQVEHGELAGLEHLLGLEWFTLLQYSSPKHDTLNYYQ